MDLSIYFTPSMLKELLTGGIGSLLGALGGAWAAQRIADKSRRRTLLIDEIRACNAAIDVANPILNSFLNLKAQHVLQMKHEYDEQAGLIEVNRLGRAAGWIDDAVALNLRVDQGSLPLMKVPIGHLQSIIETKITVSGRPQGLVAQLAESIDRANDMIQCRNDLILEFKSLPPNMRAKHLFALPLSQDGEDHRYKDCINGITQYVDDVIYFSSELSRALTRHGRRAERRFRKKHGQLLQRTSETYFEGDMWRRLAPEPARFASWEGMYVELVPQTEGRRWRRCWYRVRRSWRRLLLKPWDRWKKRARYSIG